LLSHRNQPGLLRPPEKTVCLGTYNHTQRITLLMLSRGKNKNHHLDAAPQQKEGFSGVRLMRKQHHPPLVSLGWNV
jgi:hypothetical protein